jgi:transposase
MTQNRNSQKGRHHYSALERQQAVNDLEQGIITVPELLEQYNIHEDTLENWVIAYAKDPDFSFKRKRTRQSDRRLIASQIHNKVLTATEAARIYKLNVKTVQSWLKEFPASNNLQRKISQEMSGDNESVHQQIEELQLKIIALETMIDIAEEELKIDIRKKCGTKQQ